MSRYGYWFPIAELWQSNQSDMTVALMFDDAHAMISMKSRFASSILAGQKTVELRRRFMNLPKGSKLWIYSTLPAGAIVAVAALHETVRDIPSELWTKYNDRIGIPRYEFDAYFEGCQLGVALELCDVRKIAPIKLDKIREIRGTRQMPQVAVRISQTIVREFVQAGSVEFA